MVKVHVEYVTWIDSASYSGWTPAKTAAELDPAIIQSVGWVIRDNRREVTLCAHASPESFHSPLSIPKVAILSRKRVRG